MIERDVSGAWLHVAHDVNEFDIPFFYHETVQQLAVKVNIPYSTVLKNKTVKTFLFILNFFAFIEI